MPAKTIITDPKKKSIAPGVNEVHIYIETDEPGVRSSIDRPFINQSGFQKGRGKTFCNVSINMLLRGNNRFNYRPKAESKTGALLLSLFTGFSRDFVGQYSKKLTNTLSETANKFVCRYCYFSREGGLHIKYSYTYHKPLN